MLHSGSYIGVSQIDRAIQKAQDKAEENTDEKYANLTANLEADLMKEKLANDQLKQQSEFASKVLTNAIQTGNIPTALVEGVASVTEKPLPPENPLKEASDGWMEFKRGSEPVVGMNLPQSVLDGSREIVRDHIRQERNEVEKLLTRKKELILRQEEQEVKQPKQVYNALDRLGQREGFHFELPRARIPHASARRGKDSTLETHKRVTQAWGVGAALFAILLFLLVLSWTKCRCCCRRKEKENYPMADLTWDFYEDRTFEIKRTSKTSFEFLFDFPCFFV